MPLKGSKKKKGGKASSHKSLKDFSDPNLEPSVLATRTSIGAGAKVFKPPVEAIWERYFAKFS